MTKKGSHKPKRSSSAEPKKEEKLIEEGLEAIYGKDQVDFTTLDRGKSRFTTTLLTIVATLAVVAGLSWAGFFIWNTYFAGSSEETFILSIETEEELVSGEQAEIAIHYENPNNVPLASLSLQVNLPDAFEPTTLSPTPDDLEDLTWEIGSMSAHSDGTLTIAGTWIADVPSSTPVQVFASYRPANFNADFSEIETLHINTLQSTLTTTIEGPEEAQPGETLDYTLTIENTGEEVMQSIEMQLAAPTGFFLEESQPALEEELETIWMIEQLEPGETTDIQFSGSFAADREGFHYFDATAVIQKNEKDYTQSTAQAFTDVLKSDLSLQLVANGGSETVALSPSDNLRLTVSMKNTGDTTIDDATLLVDFESDLSIPIIWNDAELDGGVITSQGISYGASALGAIAPGEQAMVNLTLPIDASVGSGQADQFTVVAHSEAGGFDIRSTPITIQINTEAHFEASLRYFDDEGLPIGSGALPPRVGESTVYRLFWTIENSLHDLEDIQISATLPPHVTWMDSFETDLGTLSFDSASRTLTWKISHLPENIAQISANASVRIEPDEEDVGTFVKIISGSSMKATDAVTGDTLSRATKSLTSELTGDDYADGKGVVVE